MIKYMQLSINTHSVYDIFKHLLNDDEIFAAGIKLCLIFLEIWYSML